MPFPVRAAVPMVTAALAVVLTSCAGGPGVPPAAAPPPAAPPAPSNTAPVTTTPPTTTAAPGPRVCNGSVDAGTGSYSVTGPDTGHLSSSDDGLFIGCADGPDLRTQIAPGSALVVTFQGRQTRIRQGRPATVGPYRIEVLSLKGSSATFRFTLP